MQHLRKSDLDLGHGLLAMSIAFVAAALILDRKLLFAAAGVCAVMAMLALSERKPVAVARMTQRLATLCRWMLALAMFLAAATTLWLTAVFWVDAEGTLRLVLGSAVGLLLTWWLANLSIRLAAANKFRR